MYRAQLACQEYASTLVSINDDAENSFITSMMGNSEGIEYFIGLHDLHDTESETDEFLWIDFTPFSYSNWGTGQPEESNDNIQNCVVMSGTSRTLGKWSTKTCDTELPYICKKVHCPNDKWISSFSNCYYISETELLVSKAEDYCVKQGGFLVDILDQYEQSEVLDMVSDAGNYWIGLSISDNSDGIPSEDDFQWSSGQPLDYTNWGTNEPSELFRLALPGGDDRYCVYLAVLPGESFWDDTDCDLEKRFICEIDMGNFDLENVCPQEDQSKICGDNGHIVYRDPTNNCEFPECDSNTCP
eukprot:UN33711